MSSTEQTVQVYQLRIWIRKISPRSGVASWYEATAPLPSSMTHFKLCLVGQMSTYINSSFEGNRMGSGDLGGSASTTIRTRCDSETFTSVGKKRGSMSMI